MTGGDLTKFGVLLQDVETVKEIVAKYNLKVVGLHEHTGSGLQHTASVFQSMKNLMAIATPENFPELRFLDFGGGFKVPYKPDEKRVDYVEMGAEITRLFSEFCEKYGKELEMYFEPGKYIVAEAGYMLVEVNTLKDNKGRQIAGCNSGFPQLIRPMFYDAYHHILNLSNPDGEMKFYDVCGNICETGDRFAEQRELPEVREGDILSIENAGAYCYAMGGVYNLRPMPTEVVVSNGKVAQVRKGVSSEELINMIIGESK
jgi:diaminopimelate decarboxylase